MKDDVLTFDDDETGATEQIGIVDEPLVKNGDDLLKIKKYSNALIKFIKSSQTPITIGVQGEWGSGKTSLLNTIYSELDRSELSDQMLTGKKLQKYMDTFKNGRRDSKAWTEAADFLETYFDDSNRIIIK